MLQNFFNKNFMFLLRPYDIINSDLIPGKMDDRCLVLFVYVCSREMGVRKLFFEFRFATSDANETCILYILWCVYIHV